MADSTISITAGSGTAIDTRTEATNGNHRQVVVIGDPATNAGVAPVDATAGLKVDLGADNDITGTVTANLSATDNAVLDAIAADTGTIAGDTTSIDGKIPALGQALAAASVPVVLTASQLTTLTPPAAISGFATSAKQDTIIGHVDGVETTLTSIDGKITAVNTGAVVLAAGTAAYGKLAANSGVDIGDVDVTSIIPGTGATNLGKAIDTATGATDTGVLALATRDDALSALTPIEGDNVQLRTNSTGALWVIPSGTVTVDGSGVTQPVSGTVTANLSATDNAVLDDIAADTEAIKTSLAGTLTVTGGGGGTEYTEDAVAAANPVGTALMLVREDGRAGSLTTTDGDNVALRGNNKGEAYFIDTDANAKLTTITGHVDGIEALIGTTNTTLTTIDGRVDGLETLVTSTNTKLDTTIGHLDGVEGVLGTIDADTGSIMTAVQLIDDTVATLGTTTYTEAATKGNIIGAVRRDADTTLVDTTNEVGPLQMNAAGQLKVEVFSGETLPVSLTSTTVTGTVDLGATDNAVLDNIDADLTTIIGHVDGIEGSVDGIEALLTTIDADTSNLSVVGGGTEATALRVTIANNSTGVLSIDDNGAAITVDGTVTADLSATDNAVLDDIASKLATIDADTSALAAGVSTEYQVDVVGALPAGTNAIGKLAANSGVDIGDVTLTAGTAAIGTLLPPDIDVTAHTNYAKKYYTNAGAATDGIIWSPAAGKRWHVINLFINVSAAATVTLEDDKAGGDEVVMKMELAANSGILIPFGEKYPLASGEDAADLLITTSAGNVYVTATGYEV